MGIKGQSKSKGPNNHKASAKKMPFTTDTDEIEEIEVYLYFTEPKLCQTFVASLDDQVKPFVMVCFDQFKESHPLIDPKASLRVVIHPPEDGDESFATYKARLGAKPVVLIINEASSVSEEISKLQGEILINKEDEEKGIKTRKQQFDKKNKKLEQKSARIERWKVELDKKNDELDKKNDELEQKNRQLEQIIESWKDESKEKNRQLQKLINELKTETKSLSSIRINAAIEHYLKQTLKIPMLQTHSVGSCCSDQKLRNNFDTALKNAKSLLTRDDLDEMKHWVWGNRHPVAHGLPDFYDFQAAIDYADMKVESKEKLRKLFKPLYQDG